MWIDELGFIHPETKWSIEKVLLVSIKSNQIPVVTKELSFTLMLNTFSDQ